METRAVVAFLGMAGWFEKGVCSNGTFSRSRPGGLEEETLTAPIRVDLRPTYGDNPLATVWAQPGLDLSLPNNHVRNLFEGCIGFEGNTKGHLWDKDLQSLHSTDSVGLDVYLAFLESQGAIITRV